MAVPELNIDRTVIDGYFAVARQAVAGIEGRECGYVSGSLIEGYGNSESDLDIFVITEAKDGMTDVTQFHFGDKTVLVGYVDDETRVDVELWSRAAVIGCAERIAACGSDDLPGASSLDERDLQFAHQLRVGISFEGPALFADLSAHFDWPHLSRVLRNRFLADYSGWAEDAVGAVKDGDAGTAMLTSRLALGSALDALLAAQGQTNNKSKWRFRKLLAHGDEKLTRSYLDQELDSSPAPDDLLRRARERLRAASLLASKAAVDR